MTHSWHAVNHCLVRNAEVLAKREISWQAIAHGKQKRTKTRKEKTEEAKNLAAKTLSNPLQASSVRPLAKRGDFRLPDYPTVTFEQE